MGDVAVNDTAARYQGYLVAQLVLAAVGTLAPALGDFDGYYDRAGGAVDVYGYGFVYLGSGLPASVLVQVDAAGLGVALHAALDSLRDEAATLETLAANAGCSATRSSGR